MSKTKTFVWNATEVCRIAFSRGSDCGGDPQRDASRKKDEKVRIFPDTLLSRRPTTGVQLSADRDY